MAIIDKPSDYFNTVLYSGTGNEQTVSGVNFQPDFTWLKSRTNAQPNTLQNSVTGPTKQMHSNANDAETSYTQLLKSFNSDGFVLGTDSFINQNGQNFVSWNWKAGGSASSNSNGSITTSISANQDSGFSMVSYTGNNSNGATIGHGLGAAPNMVIIKKKSSTAQWAVGGTNIDSTFNGYMFLDSTGAIATSDNVFNDTAPSSSVITLGTTGDSNANGQTYIAYCFHSVQGYSKFSSYIGNGNADGPFIYTGFKPGFVIMKKSSGTGNWQLFDNKRNPFNVADRTLSPDVTDSEYTTEGDIDMLSNGFKIRSTGNINADGSTYLYMAFAEQPFVTSTGNGSIPGTAR